jgi:hypothetical protein
VTVALSASLTRTINPRVENSGLTVKPLIAGMRWMLLAATLLVMVAGVDLYIFPESTGELFAWDIQPPLTAAFLGANYLAAGVVEFGAARQVSWARARVAVPAVMLFTVLTAILTFLNFSNYDLRNGMAWVWIIVYFGVPPVLAYVWWKQWTTPGSDPAPEAPMPHLLRCVLMLAGAGLAGFGLALMFAPHWASPLWPWWLASPDAGYGSSGASMETYVGVWLIAWAAIMIHAVIEKDLPRIHYALTAFAVLAALQTVAIWRFDSTAIRHASTLSYLVFLAILAATGAWGWIAARRARRGAGTPS